MTKALLPDATYTTWGRVEDGIAKAIAKPVKNPDQPRSTCTSGRPTVDKLGVKPGFKVALLASPKGFADTLKPLPAKVSFTARPDPKVDLFLCFARSRRELHAHLLSLRGRRTPDAVAGLAEEGVGREVRPRRQRGPDDRSCRRLGGLQGLLDRRHLVRPRLQAPQVGVCPVCSVPGTERRPVVAVSANREQNTARQRPHGICVFARP